MSTTPPPPPVPTPPGGSPPTPGPPPPPASLPPLPGAPARPARRGIRPPLKPIIPTASTPARRLRPWLLGLLALLLLPALVEGLLRLTGYGYSTAFFQLSREYPDGAWVENSRALWRFLPPDAAPSLPPLVVPQHKTPQDFRVFVVGDGAAMGDPAPTFGLARQLSTLWRARFPGVNVEVYNLAFPGCDAWLASHLVTACAPLHPDLFIVVLGHDQTNGPAGPGDRYGYAPAGSWWLDAQLAARRLRLVQALDAGWRRLRHRHDPEVPPFDVRPVPPLAAGDPRLAAASRQYGEQLQALCRAGQELRARVLLCTAASNLRSVPPFASQHRPNLLPADLASWEQAWQAGVAAQGKGDFAGGLAAFRAAAELDATYADLQYRAGQCQYHVPGIKEGEIQRSYVLARDLDVEHRRADTRLNSMLREVATAPGSRGVSLVDAEAAFNALALGHHGVPGDEFFLDHVHLNFHGTYILARLLDDEVERGLPPWVRDLTKLSSSRTLTEDAVAARLAYTAAGERAMAQALLIRYRDEAPRLPANLADRCTTWAQLVADRARRPADLRSAEAELQACRLATTDYERDWGVHVAYAECLEDHGNFTAAEEEWRRVGVLLPHSTYPLLGLALNQFQQKEWTEGAALCRTVLVRDPGNLAALDLLADLLAANGDEIGAMRAYQQLVATRPRHALPRLHAATYFAAHGAPAEAIEQYHAAIELRPRSPQAYLELAELYTRQGQAANALATLQAAQAAAAPTLLVTYRLGLALAANDQRDAAIKLYQDALQQHPEQAQFHYQLGRLLAERGTYDDAIDHLLQALRLDKSLTEARQLLITLKAQAGRTAAAAAAATAEGAGADGPAPAVPGTLAVP